MRWIVDHFCLGKALTSDFVQVGNIQEVQPVLHVDVLIAAHVVSHDHLVFALSDILQILKLCLFITIIYLLDTWFSVANALIATRSVVKEKSIIDKSGLI